MDKKSERNYALADALVRAMFVDGLLTVQEQNDMKKSCETAIFEGKLIGDL